MLDCDRRARLLTAMPKTQLWSAPFVGILADNSPEGSLGQAPINPEMKHQFWIKLVGDASPKQKIHIMPHRGKIGPCFCCLFVEG